MPVKAKNTKISLEKEEKFWYNRRNSDTIGWRMCDGRGDRLQG